MKKVKKIKPEFKGTTKVFDQHGNELSVALVNKSISQYANWHRVWLNDLATIVGLLGEGKAKVLEYILKETNRETNTFNRTVREIAEETKASTRTVQKVLTVLLDGDFMRKQRVASYLVNPTILSYGNDKKVGYLMIQYSELPEPTPLEAAIAEAKKKKQMEAELNSDWEKMKRHKPRITLP
jgi:DNA-binding transcriptional regulator YhcF (GntR family)